MQLTANNELENIISDCLVKYDSLDDYLKSNNYDRDDFKKWAGQGYSDDGFLMINCCYYLAGDATNGLYLPITTLKQILTLIFEEIRDSGFLEILESVNDDSKRYGDPNDLIDLDDPATVLTEFCYWCQEIALIPIDSGTYRGGYMLVVDQD